MGVGADGFALLPYSAELARWAQAAAEVMRTQMTDATFRAAQMRHGNTWFVGVNALPNDAQGAVGGIPFQPPWRGDLPDLPLHRAQVSIVYAGYPKQDPQESNANHRFRRDRCAAHVDGLLPVGPDKRRYALEHHAYILGLPLNDVAQAPTVVWRGSHHIMQDALAEAIGNVPPDQVDVTRNYQTARRKVFEHCEQVALRPKPGEAMLIHRFALHGTQPWGDMPAAAAPEGRMIAFFRPETTALAWLARDKG